MIAVPSLHAIATIILTISMFVAFARGRMPTEIVSLLTIALIAVGLYFYPLPHSQPTDGLRLAFSGFGHYALITICALMIMGRGLVVTGALDPAARLLGRVWAINRQLGMLVSLLLAFTLSMVVNDTPVLVLLLPIFVQLAANGAMPASKTLMPLNAAVLIGGMATTIGTSTNLLVVSIARDLGMPHMNVFHFTPIVLAAALVALPYLWLVMPRLLPDHSKEPSFEPRRFSALLRIPAGSDLVGKTIEQVRVKLPAGFSFDGVPSTALEAGHRLAVSGTHEALEEALRLLKGQAAPGWVIDRIERKARSQGDDIIVVEMAVTADSRLIGRTLATSGIADLYSTAVLGIHKLRRLMGPPPPGAGEIEIGEGDVLLAMGLPEDLEEFARNDGLLILDGAREVPRRSKAIMALAIMLGTIGLASAGLLPIAISALAGAILMFITGCVKFDRVGRALSAKVIVLVAASIAVGQLVLESGAAAWLGESMALGLQHLPPAAVLAAIMLFVTLLTNFASNATAATIGTPIAFSIASELGLPQEPLILAVLFGCNLCYATPIAYQTNMLIMGEGNYTFADYIRTGVPLVLLMVATLSFLLVLSYGM
ncbi:transporter [Erythrobacter sp. SG61-1L]|uniref:SLC13 family permease n=1 Tax=Erythrobacter sp. SG61-1L TaxID=1603897 RepID=UPI0006D6C2BB|nr:SLC13 family permease [Erythrobacter sp. SG61-1L]KPL67769.1 transporter [Erythrobacter sp. SG61-1L]